MERKTHYKKQNFMEISDKVISKYENFILERVNDHCLRIAIMEGGYKWHYHKTMDELFIVLEGELKIEIRNSESVLLKRGDFIKIPAGVVHKTSAANGTRTVNLTFEKNVNDTVFVEDIQNPNQ